MDWLSGHQVVRQIMLIDAPAVLGWQRWRELDEQGPLEVDPGTLSDLPPRRAASSTVTWTRSPRYRSCRRNEVAMMIACADDPLPRSQCRMGTRSQSS